MESWSNIEVPIRTTDILFALTYNTKGYKENTGTLVIKMLVLKSDKVINLCELSRTLGLLNIDKFNLISINKVNDTQYAETDGSTSMFQSTGCNLSYVETGKYKFMQHLKTEHSNRSFLNYNLSTLYILRDGNYSDIRKLFTNIEGYKVEFGRGSGQKSHVLSPLELRFSIYISAIFNNNYVRSFNNNDFNHLKKERYLPSFISKK